MAQFDYPNLPPIQETNAEEYVVGLYQALGWNQESELDPQKIKINPEHWKDICDKLNQSAEGLAASYLWMNFGPSADAKVPYGKIEIEDGAFGIEPQGQERPLGDLAQEAKERAIGRNAERTDASKDRKPPERER